MDNNAYIHVLQAVPFLIMGMGIDDTFIIMGYFRKTDPDVSPADRVANTMSKAGASIFITSITDLAAFLIGLTSSIPALRAFSVYASFGVLFDFLFQVGKSPFFMAIPFEDSYMGISQAQINTYSTYSITMWLPSTLLILTTKEMNKTPWTSHTGQLSFCALLNSLSPIVLPADNVFRCICCI